MLNKDNLPKELDNKDLKKALNMLEVINLSDEEREEYENRLNWLRIEASAVKRAEERGRAELIQMMIKQGKTVQQIVEFTGLSKEELEKLKTVENSNNYVQS